MDSLAQKSFAKVKKEFSRNGLLLLSDFELPSLTAVIAGEPVKGSWWGHPMGNLMYNLSNELEDLPAVLTVKLINKKVTYLHQDHWQALFTIASSQSDWQFKKLSPQALNFFKIILKEGTARTDDSSLKMPTKEVSKLTSKLEEKLLVYSETIHRDSGKHARVLKTWGELIKQRKFKYKKMSLESALEHFQVIKAKVERQTGSTLTWPWE